MKTLSVGVATLGAAQFRDLAEDDAGQRIVGAEFLSRKSQGTLSVGFGFGVSALLVQTAVGGESFPQLGRLASGQVGKLSHPQKGGGNADNRASNMHGVRLFSGRYRNRVAVLRS